MFNSGLFSDAIFSLTVQFSWKEMSRTHLKFTFLVPNSCSCQKGKGGVVSSEVKSHFKLRSSNNGTSIERDQFPEILFAV